jgi:hypothetical protein
MTKILYKYRAFEPFRYLVDALLKRRLYSASYFDLNDPMEGQYIVSSSGGIDENIKQKLEGKKNRIRICSLSRRQDIDLMWAHYANGDRGVVMGVEIDNDKYDVRPVDYSGPIKLSRNALKPTSAQDILSRKLDAWTYEEEERVFLEGGQYVDVNLVSIIAGSRMSNQDYSLLSELVEKLCPEVPIVRKSK